MVALKLHINTHDIMSNSSIHITRRVIPNADDSNDADDEIDMSKFFSSHIEALRRNIMERGPESISTRFCDKLRHSILDKYEERMHDRFAKRICDMECSSTDDRIRGSAHERTFHCKMKSAEISSSCLEYSKNNDEKKIIADIVSASADGTVTRINVIGTNSPIAKSIVLPDELVPEIISKMKGKNGPVFVEINKGSTTWFARRTNNDGIVAIICQFHTENSIRECHEFTRGFRRIYR